MVSQIRSSISRYILAEMVQQLLSTVLHFSITGKTVAKINWVGARAAAVVVNCFIQC